MRWQKSPIISRPATMSWDTMRSSCYFMRKASALRRQIGDQFGLAITLNTCCSFSAFEAGHFAEAERTWREIGAIHEKMGNRAWFARNNLFIAALAFLHGDFDKIRTLVRRYSTFCRGEVNRSRSFCWG